MAVLFEGDVSDTGVATFSPTRVQYMLFATLTIGLQAKPVSARDEDFVLRLGWITLGVHVVIPDVIEADFWREPWWINFLNQEVSSVPQTDYLANDFGIWADRVRWSITPAAEGHLLVVGV